MRSSSIKSLVITAAAIVAITLTTVPANALPAQSTQTRENGAFAMIKRLYNRFTGLLSNGSIYIPLPNSDDPGTGPTSVTNANSDS
jgi:hypothetical protein